MKIWVMAVATAPSGGAKQFGDLNLHALYFLTNDAAIELTVRAEGEQLLLRKHPELEGCRFALDVIEIPISEIRDALRQEQYAILPAWGNVKPA